MNQLLEPYSNTKTSSPLNTFGACRFGFNGQNKDDEIYGEGNTNKHICSIIFNEHVEAIL